VARVTPDIVTPNFEFEFFQTGRDVPLEKALESMGVKPALAVSSQVSKFNQSGMARKIQSGL
jgi:hypothetical protein